MPELVQPTKGYYCTFKSVFLTVIFCNKQKALFFLNECQIERSNCFTYFNQSESIKLTNDSVWVIK